MSDMTDAQASIVTQNLDLEQTSRAFDMLKFFFAAADRVTLWRIGGGKAWLWNEEEQCLIFVRADGTADVVHYPPGFGLLP